jgi:hypothetical protein
MVDSFGALRPAALAGSSRAKHLERAGRSWTAGTFERVAPGRPYDKLFARSSVKLNAWSLGVFSSFQCHPGSRWSWVLVVANAVIAVWAVGVVDFWPLGQ